MWITKKCNLETRDGVYDWYNTPLIRTKTKKEGQAFLDDNGLGDSKYTSAVYTVEKIDAHNNQQYKNFVK